MSFKLSDFIKKELVGKGSFGEVSKIVNIKNNEEVYAAKISSTVLDENSSNFRNLKREIEINSKVHHPGIVKFIGFSLYDFDGNKKPVIVSEYLPKGTLYDILEQERRCCSDDIWNETQKLITIYGIAASMSYLHKNGIIHRDLKPQNILMDENLYPKIADFGLSKSEDFANSTTGIKGTPIYIAPEIYEEYEYSKASDVYSFSMVVYEIITGKVPFSNLNIMRISFKVTKGERPEIDFSPSEAYNELIQCCWSQEPIERPTFDDIVKKLENNEDFLTDNIDQDRFWNYVQFIKDSQGNDDVKPVKSNKENIKYPLEKFNRLSKECKNMVKNAEKDPNVQYHLGKYLIEEKKGFPKELEIGISYLKRAIDNGNIDAAIYYYRMLIEGKVIPRDYDEALSGLKCYEDQNNADISLLIGRIYIKKDDMKNAKIYLQKSSKYGCAEAMCELDKILNNEGNKKEAKIQNGFKPINSPPHQRRPNDDKIKEGKKGKNRKVSNKKVQKGVDLVFLIDSTTTMKYYISALKKSLPGTLHKCISDHSDINFLFGFILYKDNIITKNESVEILNLTPKVSQVHNFLDTVNVSGGGIKLAKDWASGYQGLNEQIEWRDDSTKVVIHICDAPGHGSWFTMSNKVSKELLEKPKGISLKRYIDIQKKQNNWICHQLRCLIDKNVLMYCINGNENALQCFKKTCDYFINKNGKKFVIKDLFGYSYNPNDVSAVDTRCLQEQLMQFVENSINDCLDEKSTLFEDECKNQFLNDLSNFEKKFKIEKHEINDHSIESNDHLIESNDDSNESDDDGFVFRK